VGVEILPSFFYNRLATEVARALLGMRLVRMLDGVRLSGIILEAEAYQGEEDLACHARAGRTQRTQIMYGPPGHAYIYFTYGMHWMLNCVTGEEGSPAAVLIRALRIVEGNDLIKARRNPVAEAQWTNGPAKLCQAFGIDGRLNGVNLCSSNGTLWIEQGEPFEDSLVKTGPRVGIQNVPEPWRSIPWRFWVEQKDQGVV